MHRDFEGKENVIIYDYVDVHVKMLERMYQKRLSAYAAMGYTVYAPTGNDGANVIYTVRDYQETYWQDFQMATSRICTCSPRLSHRRVWELIKKLKQDKRSQIEYIILTLTTGKYSPQQQVAVEKMKKAMREAGADVREFESLNCHFAVMDDDLVWYGSMNFLSREHEDDILMRINSESIVKELLAISSQEEASGIARQ